MTIIPHEAERLFSVGELVINYKPNTDIKRERVTTSTDAFKIFRQYWSDDIARIEEFYVMCLNRANDVVGIYRV